jgi:predicted aspartyl protease
MNARRPAAALAATLAMLAASRAQPPAASGTPPDPDLPSIVVEAPEPKYVVPTRPDRIGRIWAPVRINDQGPFRLVLDTGATGSAINAAALATLGIAAPAAAGVTLHGATGALDVAAVQVDSFAVGELPLRHAGLAVIEDAFGGADGVLGMDDLLDKRVFIDFRNDTITVSRSHGQPAPSGFVSIPVILDHGLLVVPDARFGSLRVRAIIDTGSQGSIANVAAGDALRRHGRPEGAGGLQIVGVTMDVERGDVVATPALHLGALRVGTTQIAVADTYFFRHFGLTARPAVVVGMDVLGLLDALIIDYPAREIQVKVDATDRR